MDQRATTAWKKALATARGGTRAKGKQALQLSQQLQQQATALAKELTTRSPVDLAKLLFRVRAEASLAPVALLNLEVEAPRVVADAIAGQAAVVTWKPDRGTALRVVSPWPEIAGKSAMEGHQARLWVPADPPRRLLPYLLMVGDGTFTVAMPVDVQVGPPFVVKLSPQAVLRGQESRLDLSVVNRLDQSGQIEIALTAPPKVKFTPAKMSLELAARATAQQPVTITLDKHVPIGDLRITHTITSTDPRFLMKGPIFLSVEGEKNPP
jgi:hypothetical protein